MMATLTTLNPATGKPGATLPADDAASVRATSRSARLVDQAEELARTLTRETGKPIAQSRNELAGLLPRLDFFLRETPRALRREVVFEDRKDRSVEAIAREPLGLVANISAWNYPYF